MFRHSNPTDLPHAPNDGLAAVDLFDMQRALAAPLLSLAPIEERVVRLHYGIGVESATIVDIAATLGIGEARTASILKKALRKLKHPSRSRRFRSCWQDGVERSTDVHEEFMRSATRE